MVLEGSLNPGDKVMVNSGGGGLTFEVATGAAATGAR
jgi:hypothetical protein